MRRPPRATPITLDGNQWRQGRVVRDLWTLTRRAFMAKYRTTDGEYRRHRAHGRPGRMPWAFSDDPDVIAKRNKIAAENQGLIHAVLKKCRTWMRYHDHDDLVSVGQIGLMKAAEQFDPTRLNHDGKPMRFSTFAFACIHNELRHINNYWCTQGRDPRRHGIVEVAAGHDGDGEGVQWIEDLERMSDLRPEQEAMLRDNAELVSRALDQIDPRLAKCLRLRFFDYMKLDGVGAVMGFSREYARQLIDKGLDQLYGVILDPKAS